MAGLALVALAFAAAFSVVLAKGTVAAGLVAGASRVKRWGGVVLVVVGLWFVILGMFPETFAGLFPV